MSPGDPLGSRGCCCGALCQLPLQGLGCEQPLFGELWGAQDKLQASPALCFLTKRYLLKVLGVGSLRWLSAFGKLFTECLDGDPYPKPLARTSGQGVPCNPLGSSQRLQPIFQR